jgi:outer membrane protein OmpA-like peptidoglycan-associated protein
MRLVPLALVALVALVAVPAHADPSTLFPSLRLEPAPDVEGIGMTSSGVVPDQWGWDAGLVLGYEHLPLFSINPTTQLANDLVKDRFTANAIGSIALLNWLQIGIDVPVVLYQSGDNLSGAGFGDVILQPKVRLMRQMDGAPLDIAVMAPFTLPTGQYTAYTGDPTTSITPGIAISRRWGTVRIAGNLGHKFRSTVSIPHLTIGDELIYRAGVANTYEAIPDHPIDLGLSFSGASDTSALFDQPGQLQFVGTGPNVPSPHHQEIMATASVRAWGPLDVFVGLGHALGLAASDVQPAPSSGWGVPDWRALVGVRASERPEFDYDGDGLTGADDHCPKVAGPVENHGCPDVDSDGDGIVDRLDKCPNQPEDKDGFEDSDGCPDPDNDKDGVLDVDDKCPNQFGPKENGGCPDVDSDGDGIVDRLDKCPNEPEDKDGFQDSDGCPDLDNDADGIPDKDDKCPNEPGPKANQGCPDQDRDHDGVVDRFDNCPDEPGPPENGGCPKKQLVVITEAKLEIKDKVFFDTDKDTIQKKSFELLDNVADVLKAHPEIKRIRVEGHTDNTGKPEHNKDLSDRRAKSVMKYLVDKGVDVARLDAVGFGQDRPIASNDTVDGKSQNRRVEFMILENEGGAIAP